MSIAENIAAVRQRIDDSARRAGRTGEDITLLAVSKTVDVERMQEAVAAGLTMFGENRVQEIVKKIEFFEQNVSWDLIGQLQKNKIKYIIDKTRLVHSLCSVSVAQEMQRLCEQRDTAIDCLLQVNVSREESKSGIYEDEVEPFLETVEPLSRVRILGMMTIAPIVDKPEDARPYFAALKKLFDRYSKIKTDHFEMKYLSMGMSGDFEAAIEEGANIVRVGSAIFGSRNYTK